MNITEIAYQVLSSAGEPLHYTEITRRMMQGGLWRTDGKTPDATVNARLATDIVQQGDASRFQRTAKGVFALRSWKLPEFVGRSMNKGRKPAVVKGPSKGAPPSPKPTSPRTPKPRKGKAVPEVMSFTDAAEFVLEKYGDKRPMHYREITAKALELGLLRTKGQTPEATLYAQVLTEIDRKGRRGDAPRFMKHGRGFIGLRRLVSQGLGFQIERHNGEVQRKLLKKLQSIDPIVFESLVGRLLGKLGFEEVEVTRRSGDGGIDVRGRLVVGDVIRTRMAVQVKRWRQNIQAPAVQQVRGSLGAHEQGLIITTSDFSKGARQEAERPDATPVGLMNGEQLVKLLIEHDIGVERTTYNLIELGNLDEE